MKTLCTKLFLVTILIVTNSTLMAQTTTWFVDVNTACTSSPCVQDGLSWATAFSDLQDALVVAGAGNEIWVAKGIYYPTTTLDRTISFDLPSDVSVYGGFNGTESSSYDLSLRDFSLNTTILSGDLDGDGIINAGNSFHIVKTVNTSGQIIFDGFQLTLSNAAGVPGSNQRGGGIYAENISSPSLLSIRNCEFKQLRVRWSGSGAYLKNVEGLIEDCSFTDCKSMSGAAFGDEGTTGDVTIKNCHFYQNEASEGAAISSSDKIYVSNCLIENNKGTYRGGAINLTSGSGNSLIERTIIKDNYGGSYSAVFANNSHGTQFLDCHFIDNSSPSNPVIYNHTSNNLDFINCSFKGNSYTGSSTTKPSVISVFQQVSTSKLSNCIFWGNIAASNVAIANSIGISVENSIVEGGYLNANPANQTNVSILDPLWIDADLNLGLNSPAIDAGNNLLYTSTSLIDIDGDARYFNATIDMGAQESTLDPNAFVITLTGVTVNIPTNPYRAGDYSYTVNWGDGTIEPNVKGDVSHLYTDGKTEHQISINDSFPAIYYNGQAIATQLKSIDQWGTGTWRTMAHSFHGCVNMTYKATDLPDLSNVTTTNAMFNNCANFNGDLSGWNVSNIHRMTGMFQGASSFIGTGLETWERNTVGDVSSLAAVFAVPNMFKGASAFNGDITNWNISLITSLRSTFQNSTLFNRPLNWGFSNVTNMSSAFLGARAFNQNISSWDVSRVQTMKSMFRNAVLFNQDISNWNVSSVTTMDKMFTGATSFNQNLGAWDIKIVLDMIQMLDNSGLDECNYDATLNGWASNPHMSGINLGAVGVKYDKASYIKTVLEDPLKSNWTIIDAGQGSVCEASNAFVITVETTVANDSIKIPGSYLCTNYDVVWGDGSSTTSESGIAAHSYDSPGTHEIRITGDFYNFEYNRQTSAERYKLKSIDQWGIIKWLTLKSSFYYCTELEYKATDSPDLSNMDASASLQNMFFGASKISNANEIWNWDVSQVKNMASMFRGATNFNANISGWDVQNVEKIYNMFNFAASFNQPVGDWTVTNKITSLRHVFNGASSFDQPLDTWVTDNVTDMSGAFSSASSFNQNLANWNVSNVEYMNQMFLQAYDFNNGEFDLNSGQTTNLTLNPLTASDWDVSKVKSMVQMFRQSSFNQNISDWNVANVESFSQMFLSNFNFNQNINSWIVTKSISFWSMFQDASSFNQPLFSWRFNSSPSITIDMRSMFYGSAFNGDIKDWNVERVNTMRYMFYNSAFNQPLSNWDVSNVTDMSGMFRQSLFNQDISMWDVDLVKDMDQMFLYATSFNQNLGAWNIANVSDMDQMLSYSGLDECNYDAMLSGWLPTYSGSSNPNIATSLGAKGVQYGAVLHKNALITAGLTTITDDGQGNPCTPPPPPLRKKSPSSIEGVLEANLQFYPNPTSNSFTINGFEENVRVTLMDIRGKVVLQTTAFNNTSIDVSSLSKGVYILQANDESNNQINDKLIIQ